MMRTARAIAWRSDESSPVAPGAPRMPVVMRDSRVVPTPGATASPARDEFDGPWDSLMRTGALPQPFAPCTPRGRGHHHRPMPTYGAPATDRVKQILSWYATDNTGVKTNLARLMNHGTLAGTGKFVI